MSWGSPSFVLGFFAIVVGIPVVCDTIVTIIHGPKDVRKEKKKFMKEKYTQDYEKNQEIMEEIYYGLKDLGKRVGNLETILEAKEKE